MAVHLMKDGLMHRRTRALGLGLALTSASLLTAAPAFAGTTSGQSLTDAYCQSLVGPGGTSSFTTVKGVKTCRITRTYTTSGPAYKDTYGPFDPASGLTADGYDAEYNQTTSYTESRTLTQKGKTSISSTPITTVTNSVQVSDQQCYAITGASGGFTLSPVDNSICYGLNLFPA